MKKKLKGSMTVEMAIVFPIIFFVILGVLELCITQYQNVITTTAVIQSAAKGAAYWDRLGGEEAWDFKLANADEPTGKMVNTDYSDHDPYSNIIDTKKDKKISNIQKYAAWLLGQNINLQNSTTENLSVKKGGLIFKYIEVSVTKKYDRPLDALLVGYGFTSSAEKVITAKAPLNTPTGFIRDVTFIYDLVQDSRKGGNS